MRQVMLVVFYSKFTTEPSILQTWWHYILSNPLLGGRLTEPLIEKGRKKWQNKENLVQQEKIMLLISKMQIKALGGQTLPMIKIKEIEENN